MAPSLRMKRSVSRLSASLVTVGLVIIAILGSVPMSAARTAIDIKVVEDNLVLSTDEDIRIILLRENAGRSGEITLSHDGRTYSGSRRQAIQGRRDPSQGLVFDRQRLRDSRGTGALAGCAIAVDRRFNIVPVRVGSSDGSRYGDQRIFSLRPIYDYRQLERRLETHPELIESSREAVRTHQAGLREVQRQREDYAESPDAEGCEFKLPPGAVAPPRPDNMMTPRQAAPVAWERATTCFIQRHGCDLALEFAEWAGEPVIKRLFGLGQMELDLITEPLKYVTSSVCYGGTQAVTQISCPQVSLEYEAVEKSLRACDELLPDLRAACRASYFLAITLRFVYEQQAIEAHLTKSYRKWLAAVKRSRSFAPYIAQCESFDYAERRERELIWRALQVIAAREYQLAEAQNTLRQLSTEPVRGAALLCRPPQDRGSDGSSTTAGSQPGSQASMPGDQTCSSELLAENATIEPVERVDPVYPRRAMRRQLEGEVTLQFTVAVDGTVKEITVVQPSTAVFIRSAERAVFRWKYPPRIIDGVAVERPCMRATVAFTRDMIPG